MKSELATICDELARKLTGAVHRIEGRIFFKIGEAGYSVIGKLEERPVIIDLEAYGEVLIRIDCNTTYMFQILPNTFFSRFDFLLRQRVFVGEQDFDNKFVVHSNYSQKITEWLMNTEIRESIASLAPFIHLMFKKGLLRYRSKFNVDEPDRAKIINKIEILDTIAASLESLH